MLYAVTTLFNATPTRYRNFLKFAGRLRELEIPVIMLSDLALISIRQDEMLRHYKVGNPHGLWQKEALTNHAVQNLLPSHCSHVLSIDCDILLPKDSNHNQLLDDFGGADFGQPYSHIENYDNEDGSKSHIRDSLSYAWLTKPLVVRRCYENMVGPSPGACWLYARDWISANPLYDSLIVGGGDAANHWPHFKLEDVFLNRYDKVLGNHFFDDYVSWIDSTERPKHIENPIMSTITHLYHGDLENRQYHTRYKAIAGLDPSKHLEYAEDGCIKFKGEGVTLFDKSVREYFMKRKG